MSVPLFTPDWTAEEELLLLEGVEMFGLGNWTDIADHVCTKNKEECEAHYFVVYIEHDQKPLPVSSQKKGMRKGDHYCCLPISRDETPCLLVPQICREVEAQEEYLQARRECLSDAVSGTFF